MRRLSTRFPTAPAAPRRHRLAAAAALAIAMLAVPVLSSGPLAAATFTVTKTADTNDGACNADCSLREAITAANAAAGSDTITFGVAGTFTITGSALPTISGPLVVNGTSAPGWVSAPVVRIDGAGLGGGNGLTFLATATGSSVSGLSITGFPGSGIDIASGTTVVTRSYLGVAPDGTTEAGNGFNGVRVSGANCVVGSAGAGNVISANTTYGIEVITGGDNVAIRGNRIGTNAPGTVAKPNGAAGIHGNGGNLGVVGGTLVGQLNLISGNTGGGIVLDGTSSNWIVFGNYVGTDVSGAAGVGNVGAGITINSDGHTVGSVNPLGRNVISANANGGVVIGSTADNVKVFGNYIGTNSAGSAALPGQSFGVISSGTLCVIGGADATTRNVISGNSADGVVLGSPGSASIVSSNFIGLDATGTAAIPNASGVTLGGSGNTVGGDTAGERNVISGNALNGVLVQGSNNKVQGNYIGTDATGAVAIPNGSGVRAIGVSSGTIGGSNPGEGNLIAGNSANGIDLDADTSGISVLGNFVGVNAAGTGALPNASGIAVRGSGHTIGGTSAATRNVFSGNTWGGVTLSGSGNVIRGNYVGTNSAGTAAIANGAGGIRAASASGSTIGGSGAGEGNTISGNNGNGIATDPDTSSLIIQGNRIGTNAAGDAALANTGGVDLSGTGHLLGGSTAAARNLISGNQQNGVLLQGANLVVRGNYIGTDVTGSSGLGNGGYGVRGYGMTNCEIGGPGAGDGNVISGNQRGVSFEQGATGNSMRNNIVGLDATATLNLPDSGTGVEISSSGNTIGGAGSGNVIAGSSYQGIVVSGSATSGTVIQGNWIGTNKVLAAGLGNAQVGIWLIDASGNKVGGTAAGQGNVIAYNNYLGIWSEHGERNEISGNSIFGNALLGIDIAAQGVEANDTLDGDDGGNRGQNYPLLSSVVINGSSTEVQGRLDSKPSTQYRLEIFSSPTCSATGFGEGRTYHATTLITTDASGVATIAATVPLAVADPFVSATVTDPHGNTSELSPCAAVGGANPGKLQFFRNLVLSYEGNVPTGDAVLTRSHGLSGTVSVAFTSSDNTAVAGSDYTDSDQTVTFAPWEVVKVVQIPILFDPAPEPSPEFANLALASPAGGATLGQAASTLYIFDNDPANPGITTDDASAWEGDFGQQTLTFSVHLAPTDHPVTISYATVGGTATALQDYAPVAGTLSFPTSASPQTQTIDVSIWSDTYIEEDESVWLQLNTAPGGGSWVAYDTFATGKIRNDDTGGTPGNILFVDDFEIGTTAHWADAMP